MSPTSYQAAPLRDIRHSVWCLYMLPHRGSKVKHFFEKICKKISRRLICGRKPSGYSSLLRSSAGRSARYRITTQMQESTLFTSVTPLAILVAMLASSTVWPKI